MRQLAQSRSIEMLDGFNTIMKATTNQMQNSVSIRKWLLTISVNLPLRLAMRCLILKIRNGEG